MYIMHDNRKYGLKIAYVDWIDLLWIQIVPKGVFFGSTGALCRNGKKRNILGQNKSVGAQSKSQLESFQPFQMWYLYIPM